MLQWAVLEPLLPDRAPRRGRPWRDHRTVVDGVLWRTRTGSPWKDLPVGYGSWKTVYNRHRRWSADGTWEVVLAELQRGWTLRRRSGLSGSTPPSSALTTTLRVLPTPCRPTCPPSGLRWHRTDTCRRRQRHPQGAASNYKDLASGTASTADPQRQKAKPADREALGHSRGGLSTKAHPVADQRCRPLAFVTTVGQRHDAVAFELVLGKVFVPDQARAGPGRDPTTPWRTRRTPHARSVSTSRSGASRR